MQKKWDLAARRTRGLGKFRARSSPRRGGGGDLRSRLWQALVCHPATSVPDGWCLRARLAWSQDGALKLDYRLRAPRRALSIPPPAVPSRQDGLWWHSCCEAFIGVPGETGYREFNFSPSGEWAVYAFADYRAPLPLSPVVGEDTAPGIKCERRRHEWRLLARIPSDLLPTRQPGQALSLGLTAVVEDKGGGLTYWALGHPCPRPDFHHPGGRALTLSQGALIPPARP